MPLRLDDRWALVARRAEQFGGLTEAEARRWRERRFERLIHHHLRQSPHDGYRHSLADGRAWRGALPALSDLLDLPVLDKHFLAAQGYAASPATTASTTIVRTSGTTSSAVAVPHTAASLRTGLGDNFIRAFLAAGVAPGALHWGIGHWTSQMRATGSRISMVWLKRVLGEQVVVSNTLDPLDRELARLPAGPVCISSSPNYLARLARHLLAERIRRRTGTLLYGGAAASAEQREAWQEAFAPSRVIAFYPTTDAGAVGVSPADDGVYKCFSETHIVEIVDADGRQVSVGEQGDVLVTALDATAAPLIRYRIGDRATYLGCRANRVLLSGIYRRAEAALGDTLIPYATIAGWESCLTQAGFDVSAVQLARASRADGCDQPILRVGTADPSPFLARAALALFEQLPQVAYEIQSDTIASPRIEMVAPDVLAAGVWKVPAFVDERCRTSVPPIAVAQ